MAKIKKTKVDGALVYPATIFPAVKDPNTGQTLTEKLSELGSEVKTKVNIKPGKNLFNKSDITEGYFLDISGNMIANESYFTSGYIEVASGSTYYVNKNGVGGYYIVYAKDQSLLSASELKVGTITIPNNGMFIRISSMVDYLDSLQLESGDTETAYEPFTDKNDIMRILKGIGTNDNLYKGFKENTFINSDGTESASSGFYSTDYIPIHGATYIDCVGQFGNPYGGGLSFYDIDKKFVSNITESSTGAVLVEDKYVQESEIPKTAYYVRLTTYGSNKLRESGIVTDAFNGAIFDLIRQSGILEKEVYNLNEQTKTVSNEVKEVSSSLKNLENVMSKNLFNKNTITKGFFINGSNSFAQNADYFYSELINVEGGKNYYVNKFGAGAFYAIYDNSGVKIKTEEMRKGVISIPSTGSTIRISAPITSADSLQFELGEEGTPYEEYYEFNTVQQVVENRRNIILIKEAVSPVYKSLSVSKSRLEAGQSIEIPNTPNVKNRHAIAFRAKVNSMGAIRISHGTQGYVAGMIEVDDSNIKVFKNANPSEIEETITHGLSITEYIHVFVNVGVKDHVAELSVTTSEGQSYNKEVQWNGCSENVVALCNSGDYEGVKLTLGGSAWNEKVWIFGDSYTDYWPTHMNDLGATRFLLDGASGRTSKGGYESLVNEMKLGKPDVVVWMLGMNDADNSSSINSSYKTYYDSAKDLCEKMGIIFVPCTIPNVPGRVHTFKNEYIKANSQNYVDIAEVLGAEETASSWYNGLLSGDKVHPSVAGAKLIAKTLCEEFPQILSYMPL